MRGHDFWLALTILVLGVLVPSAGAADKLTFNRDIRPILSDNCFRCHGFDKNTREADLRLDVPEGAFVERDSGAIPIVPGKPEESEVVRRITSEDESERMPPVDAHQSLTAAEIEAIKSWIREGAEYEAHWSFIAPEEPEVPQITDPKYTVRNPIDAFVAERLQREKLPMSPEADKAKLLRRVSLDLTGLPPTLEELDAFLADTSPDAYEKAVDRLLASPHYGERMVLEWLDAARYADTNGYQGDQTRTMWPWRDWAIRAMNDNMPFDQFTIEQIAGDLLPDATMSQKLATGFVRCHPLNGEGGRIPEESRNDYVMDRIETVGTVWLGLTVGCCRCHDHKYDPLLQKEYYQGFAYFNNVAETGAVDHVGGGGNTSPVLAITTPEQDVEKGRLQSAVAAAETRLQDAMPQIDTAQAQWELAQQPKVVWEVHEFASTTSQGGSTFTKLDDGSMLVGGPSADTDVHEVVIRTQMQGITALRLEAIRHDSLPKGGPGRADSGNFVLTSLDAEVAPVQDLAHKSIARFKSAVADYAQSGFPPEGAIDGDQQTGWAVYQAPNEGTRVAIFMFSEPLGSPGGTELRLKLSYQSKHVRHTMGRFRLSLTTAPSPEASLLPANVQEALAIESKQRSKDQQTAVSEYYRKHVSADYQRLQEDVKQARKALNDFTNALPHCMVMKDLPEPRETFVLEKGIYTKRGEKVTPGVFASLYPPGKEMPKTRLDFARWLVDPENPLTARVTVNRYWQRFFGVGLVKTTEDFGVQGEPPSHPELLDWLAVRFVKSGWDVKAMHRLMVTSATYRQSSRTSPELLERDPDNRLLARGPRHRLPAFTIRDQALAVSGLLVDKLGGPPVKPYMAAGVWEDASTGKIKYERDKGEGLYRRSVYTFWRRIAAPAMFFDISVRNVCTVRLPLTNTPLQALILMNDVQYVEAARNLATRVIKAAGEDPRGRIVMAFRMCTSRLPDDAEMQVLTDALEQFRVRYEKDNAAAEQLISMGDSPRPADVQASELAAYTGLMSLILNLDETITKE